MEITSYALKRTSLSSRAFPTDMSQQVRQLLNLIANSVESLEKACTESNTQLPDLNKPYTPDSEAFRATAAAAKAASVISAAAMQLDAFVSPPRNVLYYAANGVSLVVLNVPCKLLNTTKHWKSAALRVCVEGNVTEILREAGPEVDCQ